VKENTKKEVFSWIKTIVFTLVVIFIFRTFLFTSINVSGDSMVPTFEDKDRLLVNKTAKVERFDMIVFDAPDSDSLYIKRVIGLPGDSVEVKNDVLYINGEEVKEPYIKENKEDSPSDLITGNFTLEELTGETQVPEGKLFVMGDNRLYSKDSREFGFITNDSVIGEASFRYFPFNKIGLQE
jgi:signal peptidase I